MCVHSTCHHVDLCVLGRRSYLGTTLQDDIESEKELLQQQRSEVAELREELKRQVCQWSVDDCYLSVFQHFTVCALDRYAGFLLSLFMCVIYLLS